MALKLYTCPDSPPGRAVQMALTHLNKPYTVIDIDFDKGEQFSPEFLKISPQGELPVLQDDALVVAESVAIVQYLAEKYGPGGNDPFYPVHDPHLKIVMNQRLCFFLSTLQTRIYEYYILPFDYGYDQTENNLIRLKFAMKVLNQFIQSNSSPKYIVGDKLTIVDVIFMSHMIVLIAGKFDYEPYPGVVQWMENYKTVHSDLWKVAEVGLKGFYDLFENPRDLSHLKHPLHSNPPKTV